MCGQATGDFNGLLIYDSHFVHFSIDILKHFDDKTVAVFDLPAHTSRKTLLLDVAPFSCFKNTVCEDLDSTAAIDNLASLCTFYFLGILRRAFHDSFTRSNIYASFLRSGMWPLNTSYILGLSLSTSEADPSIILPVHEISIMLDDKRKSTRNEIICVDEEIIPTATCTKRGERSLLLRQRRGLCLRRQNETEKSDTVIPYFRMKEQ